MSNDRNSWSKVIGQIRRTNERGLRSPTPGQLGYFFIIRRDNDAIEQAGFSGRADGPGNHGPAAKVLDVLSRDPLAAAACRNDGNFHHKATPFSNAGDG